MKLLFLQYNNYFNRIHKINDYVTLADWKANVAKYKQEDNVNFYVADGVDTSMYVNWTENWDPDYLIAADNNGVIQSKWFITEWKLERGNQYNGIFRRDVITDNETTIKESTFYIDRGTPLSIDDTTIRNSEGFSFNQIQKTEEKLKDKSGTAWVVGYYDANTYEENISVEFEERADITVASLPDVSNYRTLNEFDFSILTQRNMTRYDKFNLDGTHEDYGVSGVRYNASLAKSGIEIMAKTVPANATNIKNIFLTYNTNYHESKPDLYYNNGLIYYVNTGADAGYYTLHITETSHDITIRPNLNSIEEAALNQLFDGVPTFEYPNEGISASDRNTVYNIKYFSYNVVWEPMTFDELKLSIPETTRKLDDAPYKMFCMPYSPTKVFEFDMPQVDPIFTSIGESQVLSIARRIFSGYNEDQGTGVNCYDIQLLPYCPIPGIITDGRGGIFYNGLSPHYDYEFITDESNVKKGIILFPKTSSFKGHIDTIITCPTSVEEFKVKHETEFYRLISPNYASVFEFKITNNVKNITRFEYAATYKPYNPYINVYPSPVSGLYGKDFKNNYGLICSGDFSISLMNDAWKQYQLNNKNYEVAFNKQIETMDSNFSIAKQEQTWKAVAGSFQGAAGGALAGSFFGPYGALGGAAIGGGLSAIGGAIDAKNLELRYANERNLATANHFYDLANVKAMPHTISKISTVDVNNKIFPILAKFDSTENEKTILKQHLKYSGYRIDRLTTLDAYFKDFVKGTLIRMEDTTIDTHMLFAINEEMSKGIYVKEAN